MSIRQYRYSIFATLLLLPSIASAALPAAVPVENFPVRYLSLGDSLAAGFKAQPATEGFAYQLYLDKAFGSYPKTAFANLGIPGATSDEVLAHQVPQAHMIQPNVVTLSVGGNDLLKVLAGSDPRTVLTHYGQNLANILMTLCRPDNMREGGHIYLNNLYTIKEYDLIFPGANEVILALNETINDVVAHAQSICAAETPKVEIDIADVYSAFQGQKDTLLIDLYQRKGIAYPDIHPTNKGYRLMEKAYLAVIHHRKHHR